MYNKFNIVIVKKNIVYTLYSIYSLIESYSIALYIDIELYIETLYIECSL